MIQQSKNFFNFYQFYVLAWSIFAGQSHNNFDHCKLNAKQKLAVNKSARPIRRHNGYKRPKTLISRIFIKNPFT